MNIEELREYALSREGATESFPFGETTLVFKVNNKIFLLASLDEQPLQFNVKCLPERAIELREMHESVLPGYHMNKKHWNTILVDGSLSRRELQDFINDSYHLVKGLAKKKTQ